MGRGHINTVEVVMEKYVPSDDPVGCWVWAGTKEKDGYGVVQVQGRQWRAHRFIYEALVGKVADGLQLDHLCRNRLCVNPAHLEPVTCEENIGRSARATSVFCGNGHLLVGDNLRINKSGKYWVRCCVECAKLRQRAYAARKRARING